MSQRAHFWLRVVGLAIILALEFGPRIWLAPSTSAPVAAAVAAASTR